VAHYVLVADDEFYITSLVALKLRQAGYEVTTVDNGAQALAKATERKPDLVITDYQMPAMNGYEFAVALKSNPATADVPLVLLSARSHLLEGEQIEQTNIKQIVAKPFSPRNLLATVNELLGVTTEAKAPAA
jgi:CheY-like chemotaxis protein